MWGKQVKMETQEEVVSELERKPGEQKSET